MNELYSKPLSPEARLKLIDFIEAYIETLMVAEIDERAEIAKKKAIEVLNTDIDIVVFVITLMTLFESTPFIDEINKGNLGSREVAEVVVEVADKARKMDKSSRPGGKEI